MLKGMCAAAVLLAIVGCGGATKSSTVVGEGGGRFPDRTFTEWVSYADQLSVVLVVAEAEEAPAPADVARGEGYISRTVTLRVEQTLWRRAGAPAVTGEIPVVTSGWVLQEGERRPFAIGGGPRLEVGRRYVAPLVRAARDGVAWTPLSVESTLPLGIAGITTEGVLGAPSSLAKGLEGSSPSDLAAILRRTRPDPVAARHFDLPPDARVKASFGAG